MKGKVTFSDGRKATIEGENQEQIVAAVEEYETSLKTQATPQGGSIADSLGQGLSFGFSDELAGLAGAIPASISQESGIFDIIKNIPEHYKGVRDQARANHDAFSARNPGTDLAAQIGGGLLTGGAGAARALGGLTGKALIGGSAKYGSKLGALAGYGGSEADTVQGALADTAIGAGAGAIGGAAFPALGTALNAGRARLAQHVAPSAEYAAQVALLKNSGVGLTSGQQLGSNWQKAMETQLAQVPIGGTPLQRTFEGQREQVQRNLLQMAGLDDGSSMITRKTLERTDQALSDKYAKAFRGVKVAVNDNDFLNDLGQVEARNVGLLPFEQRKEVSQIIDEFLDMGVKKGSIDGEDYQRIRSTLGKRAKTNNTTHAALYKDLKSTLDNAFRRAAGGGKFDVDSQYARYKQLQTVHDGLGGAEVSEGFLPLASVAREASGAPGGAAWQDYTRAASSVLPDRIPNSGTAQRNVMMGLMTGGAALNPILAAKTLLASRLLSSQMAKGRLDVTKLLPGGGVLATPFAAGAAAPAAGLLTQSRQP